MAHVRGLRAVFAVTRIIDHQDPAGVRGGRRVRQQQLQPAGVDLLRIPPGFGQEELQPLHRRMLRPCDRFGSGQRGQGLVPVPRNQQTGQVLPEPRRCAKEPNRSSNRAAYASSGPGAAGHGRRRIITSPQSMSHTNPGHTANPARVNKLPLGRAWSRNWVTIAGNTGLRSKRPAVGIQRRSLMNRAVTRFVTNGVRAECLG
jgi:hypothetical protein